MDSATEVTTVGRRERKKRAQHQALFEAALRLFARHGYSDTTITQITDAADVSVSTFFTHFRSKEDVAFDGFDAWWMELGNHVLARPAGMTTVDSFASFVRASLGPWYRGSTELEVLRLEVITASPELENAFRRRLKELFEPVLCAGYGRDLGCPADGPLPRMLAGATVGAYAGFSSVKNEGFVNGTLMVDDVIELFEELVLVLRGSLESCLSEP